MVNKAEKTVYAAVDSVYFVGAMCNKFAMISRPSCVHQLPKLQIFSLKQVDKISFNLK